MYQMLSIKHIGQSMDQVRCKLQNLLSLVLSSQACRNLLHSYHIVKNTASCRKDYVISELSCTSPKVNLKGSLVHGNFLLLDFLKKSTATLETVENGRFAVSS